MTLQLIVFIVLALFIAVCSVLAVTTSRILRAATYLLFVLFGTAGIKALSSKDAKKLYTNATAAVLRAKECVMDTVTTVQENAEDIYEEAKQIYAETDEAEEAEETEEVSEDAFKEVEE